MQVRHVVSHRPEVQKISFVAHSLGGLIARYAIGRLYENSPKLDPTSISGNSPSEEEKKYSMQQFEQPCEARIAGLQPTNFITFATPHLGSRGNKQVNYAFFYVLSMNNASVLCFQFLFH